MDFSHTTQIPVYSAVHGLADVSATQHVTHVTLFDPDNISTRSYVDFVRLTDTELP